MTHEETVKTAVHTAYLNTINLIKEKAHHNVAASLVSFLRTCNIRTVYMFIDGELAAVRVKDFTDEALMEKEFLQSVVGFNKVIVAFKVFTGEILSFDKIDKAESYKLDREFLFYKDQSQRVNCINVKFTASVHSSTFMGDGVTVGANAVVGMNCIISDSTAVCKGSILCDNIIVGDNCLINEAAYLEGNNFIGDKVNVGRAVRIAGGVGVEEHMTIPAYASLPATPDGKLYNARNTAFANIGDITTITLYKCTDGIIWVAFNLQGMMTIAELSNIALTNRGVSELRSGFGTIMNRAHQLETAE